MDTSRTSNSIRNSSASVFGQITSILLNFIARTFFIRLLNADYLGINGLFTDILTVLSLAEMGVGTAIMYMMYEPIAKNDIRMVASYVALYRKIYTVIGCVIYGAGLAVTPFLHLLIKNVPDVQEDIRFIYILFLTNTSVSYFFTYKRSLITAYQKNYLNSINEILFAIIKDVLQIAVLFFFRNYYLYLAVAIVTTFLSNLSISRRADKLFPEIMRSEAPALGKAEKSKIAKNTVAMISHKIGSVAVSGTGSLLISAYVGLDVVGVYSNYKMLSTYLRQIINRGIQAVTASFGNLITTNDHERVHQVFNRVYFVNFFFAFFISVCFYGVANAFVLIWAGDGYVLGSLELLIVAVNMFLNQIREPSIIAINTYGLFWNIKWKSLIEAGINLVTAVILASVCDLGLLGILLGSLISNVTTNLWWEPYVAFKYGMKRSCKAYYGRLVIDTVLFLAALGITNLLCGWADTVFVLVPLLRFLLHGILSAATVLVMLVLFYGRKAEFRYTRELVFSQIKRVFKKLLRK